jgi:hypothetical protein
MMKKVQARKTPDKTMREVAPNAAKTLTALREMGYDSQASIMDLVDNSIDAGATLVDITIKESGKSCVIDILDDGKGMDEKTLAEALRLGSDTEHTAEDLGKFGMGLVTASLSMARNIWIVTRQEGKTGYEATFDMGTIERENKFVISLTPARSDKVVGVLDQHGTLVRLSQIDRINDRNVARFAANLRTKLGQVYRHFLAKGVKLVVNRRQVVRYDPLMLEHPATEVILDSKFDLGDGTEAKLVVVELPELGQAGDAENNIFPDNSGFYVVRNGREIIAGETFGFYKKHHAYSHFRAELSYTGKSTVFHEDIKKASIHPDDKLLERLRRLTEKLIAQSGRRGRDREDAAPLALTHKSSEAVINQRLAALAGAPELAEKLAEEAPKKRGRPTKQEQEERAEREAKEAKQRAKVPAVSFIEADAGDTGRFFTASKEDGKLVIAYNTRHPFVRMVAESKQKQASAILDLVSFSLAKAEEDVPDGKKLINKACDYLKALSSPEASNGK